VEVAEEHGERFIGMCFEIVGVVYEKNYGTVPEDLLIEVQMPELT
jgi:hypothetical protein